MFSGHRNPAANKVRGPVTVDLRAGKNPTLKKILRRIQGKKPWLLVEYEALISLLRESDRENELSTLIVKSATLSITGLLIGILA